MRNTLRQYFPIVFCGILYAFLLAWFVPIPAAAEGPMNQAEAITFYENLLQDARVASYGSAGRAAIESALSFARSGDSRAYSAEAEAKAEQERSSAPVPPPSGPPSPPPVPPPTLTLTVAGAAPATVGTGTWNVQSGGTVTVQMLPTQSDRIFYDVGGCASGIKVFVGGTEKQCEGEQELLGLGRAVAIRTEFICNGCTSRDVLITFSAQNSVYRVNRSIVLSVAPQQPPLPPPPLAPVPPTVRLDSDSIAMADVARFSWTRAENADVCSLFIDGAPHGAQGSVSCDGSAEPVVFSGSDLSGGMPRSFSAYIQACNRANNCISSNTVTLTVRAPTVRPRSAPTVSVEPREIAPEQTAVFTWTAASSDATECVLYINLVYNHPLPSCAAGQQEFIGRRLAEILGVAASLTQQPIWFRAHIRASNSAGVTRSNLAELRVLRATTGATTGVTTETTGPLVLPPPPTESVAPMGLVSMGPDAITPLTAQNIVSLTWQEEPGVLISAYYDCMDGVDNAHLSLDDAFLYVAGAPYYIEESDGERRPNAIGCGKDSAVNLNGDRFLINGAPRLNLIGANNSGASRATLIHVIFRRGSNITPRRFQLTIHPAPQAAAPRTATLSAAVDETNLSLQERPAGSRDVELLRLRISGTVEPIALRQIALRASDNSNLDALVNRTVTVWHNGNQVGSGVFAQGNTALAAIQNVTIPQDGFVVLTIKGSIAPTTLISPPVNAGDTIQINYDGGRTGTDGTWGAGVRSGSALFSSSQNTAAPGIRVRAATASERAAALAASDVVLRQPSAEGNSIIGGTNFHIAALELPSHPISCIRGECFVTVNVSLDVTESTGGVAPIESSGHPFLHFLINGVAVRTPADLSSLAVEPSPLSRKIIPVILPLPEGGAQRIDVAVLPNRRQLNLDDVSADDQPFSGASAVLSVSIAGEAVALPEETASTQSVAKLARQASTIAVPSRVTDPTLPFDVFGEGVGVPTRETRLGMEMRTYTRILAPHAQDTVILRWNAGGIGSCRLYSSRELDIRNLPLSGTRALVLAGTPLETITTYTIQCGDLREARERSLIIRVEPPSQQRAEAPRATTQSGEPFPELLPTPPPPFPFCDPTAEGEECVRTDVPTTPTTKTQLAPSGVPETEPVPTEERQTRPLPNFQFQEE